MSARARVLIVDASRESRDILKTLLNRQGTETFESSHRHAASIADRQQPDLIVCDADGDHSPARAATQELAQQATRSAIPIVVLGTARRDFPRFTGENTMAKPYHYGPLIRKIEQLLETRR